MKRLVIVIGFILVVAAGLVFVSPPQQSAFAASSQQAWGGWYFLATVGPSLKLPSVFTRNQDGTASLSTGQMFGGLQNFPFHLTPFYGVWTLTDPNTIQSTALLLRFDASTGLLKGITRARTEEHFVDSDHTQGLLFLETINCPTPLTCPDPFDPQAEWVPDQPQPSDGFPIETTRIHVVPAGPLQ
jgi:hypothetical protein